MFKVLFVAVTMVLWIVEGSKTANETIYHQVLTRKSLGRMTLKFVDYHLYFHNEAKKNIDICLINEDKNLTQMMLSKHVRICPDTKYLPRVLSRNQVSWKSHAEEKEAKALKNKNATNNGTENVVKKDEANEKVHNYLLFAMLLPSHPFSQDLHKLITTVVPMFPQVVVVVGNANEFRDMCSKYAIHSYPKLLFFTKGIYEDSYEGDINHGAVASYLAKWTNSLPQAVPKSREGDMRFSSNLRNVSPIEYMTVTNPLKFMMKHILLWRDAAFQRYSNIFKNLTTTNNTTNTINNSGIINNSSSSDDIITDTKRNDSGSSDSNNVSCDVSGDGTCNSSDISNATADRVVSSDEPSVDNNSNSSSSAELSSTTTKDTNISEMTANDTRPHLSIENNRSNSSFINSSHWIFSDISLPVPVANMEPFIGSVNNHKAYDHTLFIISGLYFVYKVALWVFSKPVAGAV